MLPWQGIGDEIAELNMNSGGRSPIFSDISQFKNNVLTGHAQAGDRLVELHDTGLALVLPRNEANDHAANERQVRQPFRRDAVTA